MHVLIFGEWAVDDWGTAEFLKHVYEGWYAAAKVIPGELGVDPVSELFVSYGCVWWRCSDQYPGMSSYESGSLGYVWVESES